MTKEEMKQRLEKLEKERFLLEMKDRWNAKDYDIDRQYRNEIRELKKEIENNVI